MITREEEHLRYSRQEMGKKLKEFLFIQPIDLSSIAKWAETMYWNMPSGISNELKELVLALMAIDEEGFEYTEEQLNILADKLIKNEENALKQVNKQFKIFDFWEPKTQK